MPEAFAGFVCGYALALVATPLAALALVRARTSNELLRQVVPEGTSLVAVSVILHGAAFLAFTAIGMLLGLLLLSIEERRPEGGLGSPSGAYTLVLLAIVAIAVLPLALVAPRLRAPLLAGGLLFAGVFGWLMPYLALWAPNEG